MIPISLNNFIPELWSGSILENLHRDLVFGDPLICNQDYTGEIANYGDTVRINSIGPVTLSSYTKNTDHVAPQTLSDAQQVLVIDQAKMFNFQIDDIDQHQQNPKLMSSALREASFAIAADADSFLANLLDANVPGASAGNGNWLADVTSALGSGGTPANLYYAFTQLGVVLDQNVCPREGRWAVLTPALYGAILNDPKFVSFGTQANRETVATRAVGNIAGFNILVSNNMVSTSGHDNILAGHNMAATFANNLSQVEAYRPQLRFADAVKGLHVYGGKVVRPNLLAKVTVAS